MAVRDCASGTVCGQVWVLVAVRLHVAVIRLCEIVIWDVRVFVLLRAHTCTRACVCVCVGRARLGAVGGAETL